MFQSSTLPGMGFFSQDIVIILLNWPCNGLIDDLRQKRLSSIALPLKAPNASELMINRSGRFQQHSFLWLIEVPSVFNPNLFHV